ncbi:MAG: amidohydrolase family protein [Phaeodactylibacter sp.]|nr:amidohydrolase family protein [Phaeodactylibacter sp.]
MRIDAHQHFWAYDPKEYGWISDEMPQLKQDRLPDDLAPLLSAARFDGCIAVQARQHLEETDFLLSLAADHPFIKGVVGWMDLQSDDLETTLEQYKGQNALKGIRHIVQDEPDDAFLIRPAFIRGVQLLGQQGYTYDILVFEKHLPVVVDFLERCPDQPFVLDHLGKPVIQGAPSAVWIDHIRAIAEHPNVYCKLSGLVTEADWHSWKAKDFLPYLDHVFEAFGPDRLMIGSDWPVCLLAANDYGQVIDVVRGYLNQLDEEAKAAILGNTAAQFYNLN